jgi:hypothetical protein
MPAETACPKTVAHLLLGFMLACLCGWSSLRMDLRDGAHAGNHQYEQIVILAPQDQATVFDNAGHVDIQILISPALALAQEHKLELYLDGQPALMARTIPAGFALDGLDRGGHWLQARIVNAAGETVIASEPVQFFMWQASRRIPNRG